jgi:hypothetical protein
MATEVPPVAGPVPLAQQRTSLWADPDHRLYAAMLATKVPNLRQRLAQSGDVDDWDGLWTGELDAEERAYAPVLVTLRRESGFTDWLLGEAHASFAGWGVLVQSRLPFLAMRKHARELCKAQLPNGQAIRVNWMDPEVMEALLPVASPDELNVVYGGLDSLITFEPQRWTRWSMNDGRLQRQATTVT